MFSFNTIPFVRILVPFVLGIFLGRQFGWDFNAFYLLLILAALLLFLNLKKKSDAAASYKWLYLFTADVFLFISALHCLHVNDIRHYNDFYGNFVNGDEQVWSGEIMDLPQQKERFYKLRLEVKSIEASKTNDNLQGEVIVYLKKPVNESELKPGNILQIKSRFTETPGPMNPYEFDYRDYLARRQIYYQSFVDTSEVSLVKKETGSFSLLQWGLELKQSILAAFKNSGLSIEAAQLCSALITGYDDEINAETINAFAHSGTLHVLSVSGLHTGILYAVIVFLLGLFDRHRRYKWLHVLVVTLSLFLMCLITGFSAPVLRSALMLALLMIGRFYFNYNPVNSINIIAVSAFLVLVFNPLLLYDTGFLLSYLAVTGIIYFEPYFSSFITTENYFLKKVAQLTSVSVAAQLGTLPVTLYLFHQLPLWFVFSNLLVIPVCTVIMFLAFALLCKLTFFAPLINLLTAFVLQVIRVTDKPGWGYIDRIDFSANDLIFLGLLIIVFSYALKRKSYRALVSGLCLLILWQMASLRESYERKSAARIGIYQVNRHFAYDIKNATALMFNSDTLAGKYDFHIKPNHTASNYPDIHSLNADYIAGGKYSFFHLQYQKQLGLISFLTPEYILVSNEPQLDELFFEKVRPALLVADGSNSYRYIKALKENCEKFQIAFYSTREKGYLQVEL